MRIDHDCHQADAITTEYIRKQAITNHCNFSRFTLCHAQQPLIVASTWFAHEPRRTNALCVHYLRNLVEVAPTIARNKDTFKQAATHVRIQ